MADYKVGIRVDADAGGAEGALDGLIGQLGGLGDIGGLIATGGLGLAGAAIVGVGAAAINTSLDIQDSSARMTAALGLAGDEGDRFRDIMTGIYEGNFGQSFDDISNTLVTAQQQFSRLGDAVSDADLQTAAEDAFRLRDAFGPDTQDSLSAAATLMDQFGLTSREAFDFITTGYQRGLDASGDFLDSIGEYSNLFADGQGSADQFFSLLESGLQGGVLGTDKAADAFKEFSIRFQEGGDAARQALTDIGIDADLLYQQFADGQITVADAFQLVIDKLGETTDPLERTRAGVALIGTQYEDLGETAVAQLDLTQTALSETEGATASLDAQYDTLRSDWEAASRQMQLALVPVGDELMKIGTEAVPYVVSAIQNVLVPALQSISSGRAFEAVTTSIDQWRNVLGFGDNTSGEPQGTRNLGVVNPANVTVNVQNSTDVGPVVNSMQTQGAAP